jgi:hypothetical protein
MAPTTQLAFAAVLPDEVLTRIDSFRRRRRHRAARDRMALYMYQRRHKSLRAKIVATGRFDITLPPFPATSDLDDEARWMYGAWADAIFQWFREHYRT